MTGVFQAAASLQQVCDRHLWKYCFIGGSRFSVGANHA